jgi:hypothetical protein
MNAARFTIARRLVVAGLLVGSLFGFAGSASAQTVCMTWPCPPPSEFTLTPVSNPDLTVGVTASPNPVLHGSTHTYVLRVSNFTWGTAYRGFVRQIPGMAVSNVRVHLNAYPSNERLVSARDDTGTGFTCYTPAEYFGMDVRCIGGSIPSGGTAQITLTMTAPTTAGAFTARAGVDPYSEIVESDETNNTSAVGFSVI